MPELISVREHPERAEEAIGWFQSHWATKESEPVYQNCIALSLYACVPLPQWYLLTEGDRIIGGAGLIPNDFISRMDLYPWLCALYIEPEHRGHRYGELLLTRAARDAQAAGFPHLYVCTDLIGYYEKMGGTYIGIGHHPWGERSRIYRFDTGRKEHAHGEDPHCGASTSPESRITYRALSEETFHPDSLDGFVRHQVVSECWRRIGGELALVPVAFTEEWTRDELRQEAEQIINGIRRGWYACGAFCGGEVVGYLLLRGARFGSRKQYLELKEFYVSEPYRRKGIGTRLFRMGAAHAARAGAEKLYISAHSSKESQETYRKLGCTEAEEPAPDLSAREPCDVQMEYVLQKSEDL